jgi:hypothetical protein
MYVCVCVYLNNLTLQMNVLTLPLHMLRRLTILQPPFLLQGSVVGIATAYGLEGPEIESRWGRDFPHLSRPALRPTQPPEQRVPSLSRW